MKEKDLNKKTNPEEIKLEWEAPKLLCLDKGKTENGSAVGLTEGDAYSPGTLS